MERHLHFLTHEISLPSPLLQANISRMGDLCPQGAEKHQASSRTTTAQPNWCLLTKLISTEPHQDEQQGLTLAFARETANVKTPRC